MSNSKLAYATIAKAIAGISVFFTISATHAQSTTTPFVLVPTSQLISGGALSTFGYDPSANRIFATASTTTAEMRVITGFDIGGTLSNAQYVPNNTWQTWTKGGNGNNGGGVPVPGSLTLNPKAIGSIPAYSFAVLTDGAALVTASSVGQPALSQRVYSYNLQPSGLPVDPTQLGKDVFTSLVTLSKMQTAASATSTSTNVSRQGAFSGDGQRFYYYDTSTAFGGLWSVNLASPGSNPVRLATYDGGVFEPAVKQVGTNDAIYVSILSTAGGGIGRYTTDGTTAGTSAISTVVSQAALTSFFGVPSTTQYQIGSMTFDDAGNLYFNVTSPTTAGLDRRGIYRLDDQGRLVKIVEYKERSDAFGGSPNVSTQRPQTRILTGSQLPAGYLGTSLTQLMWAETTNTGGTVTHSIAASNVYDIGDFNYSGISPTATAADIKAARQADLAIFSNALTVRNQAITVAATRRLDLNGDNVVDYADVKVLQQFIPFADGDANFDLDLNIADVNVVRDNYLGTGKTWATGDFASATVNYPAAAADANVTNFVDLQALANSWINVLGQPTLTISQVNANSYSGQFRADVITAFNIKSIWAVNAPGSFSDSGNWTGGVPDGVGAVAIFGSAINDNRIVSFPTNRTVGSLTFDNVKSYSLTGSSTLTLDAAVGSATIAVTSGSHTIGVPVVLADPTGISVAPGTNLSVTGSLATSTNALTVTGGGTVQISGNVTGTGSVTVSSATLIAQMPLRPVSGTLVVTGAGALVQLAAPTNTSAVAVAGEFANVTVGAGASLVLTTSDRSASGAKGKVLVTSALSIAGTLDVTNNDLIVKGGSFTSIRDAVTAWYNGGAFDGTSTLISSSAGGTTGLGTLAVVANSVLGLTSFDGITVGAADVLVKYTYLGDTNLDGKVDPTDLAALIGGIRGGLQGWQNGDTNYDGVINAVDYANLLVALRYQGSPFDGASSGSPAGGAIPEPSALVGFLVAPLITRRRKR